MIKSPMCCGTDMYLRDLIPTCRGHVCPTQPADCLDSRERSRRPYSALSASTGFTSWPSGPGSTVASTPDSSSRCTPFPVGCRLERAHPEQEKRTPLAIAKREAADPPRFQLTPGSSPGA